MSFLCGTSGVAEALAQTEPSAAEAPLKNTFKYFIAAYVNGLTPEEQHGLIAAAYKSWSKVANLHFLRTMKRVEADIIHTVRALGTVGGVLALTDFGPKIKIVLDGSETWDAALYLAAVCHEGGHAIGLHLHSSDVTALMAPSISTSVTTPQSDDIRRARKKYGKPK